MSPLITRRVLLEAGAGTGVAVAAAAPAAAVAADGPTRAQFTALVGRTFTATRAGREIRLRLDDVADSRFRPPHLHGDRLAAWRRASYELTWSTAARAEEGTYRLRHPATGRFPQFMVPLTRHDGRLRLTAIYNGWRG